jgi:hypothetical protein
MGQCLKIRCLSFLEGLRILLKLPIMVKIDNIGAISIAENGSSGTPISILGITLC